MKKLIMAVAAACATVVAQAETSAGYVTDNLVAFWDGYENNGAGGHATELTEWKDTTGQYSFVFNGSGITVDGASLVFSGASGCYATLDATGTAATFDLARNGTMEIVFKGAADQPATCHLLQSSTTSGISAGSYTSPAKWIVSNATSPCPLFDGRDDYTTLAVRYTNGGASASYANAESLSTDGSASWSGPDAKTYLGARASKSSLFKGEICAIRLYSTQLTSEQLAANRAVDVKRFVEGNYNMLSGVSVQGFPRYATAAGVPQYGFFPCAAGETVTKVAPASFVEKGGRRIDCLGWKLYDDATGALVAESDEQDKLKCEFTYSTPVKLVWQWKAYDMLTIQNFDDDLATVYVNDEPTTNGQKVAIDGQMTIELRDFRDDYYFRFAPESQTDRELAFDYWEGVPEGQTTENPTTFTPEGDITITPNVDVKGYCWTPVTSSVIEDAILSMKFSKTDATRSVTTSGGNSNRVGVTENVLTFDAVERVRINDKNYTIKSFTGRPAFGNTHICQIALSPNFTTFGSTITDGSGFIITNLIGTAELKAPSYGWYSFYYGPAQLSGPVANFISPNAVDFVTGNAFQGKSGMKGPLVLNCVRSITANTFLSCSGLTELYCPSPYLTTIGDSAFSGCSKLTKVTLGAEALTSVATSSFTANVTDFVFLSGAPDETVMTAILSAQANVDGAHKATVWVDPAKPGWADLIAVPTAAEIAAGLPRNCLGVFVDADAKRKAWVCVSDNADGVVVEGSPREYAADNLPAYGFMSQTAGAELVYTAPDSIVVSDDEHAACMGWKLFDRVTGELVTESTDENKTRCAFTYEKPVRLIWYWAPTFRIAPVITADGLSVSPSEIWIAEDQDVTFTVTGTDHPVWTVGGVIQSERGASITVRVSPGLQISVGEDLALYVTPDGAGQKDGSSWENAFAGLQGALTAAKAAGVPATLKVLAGDYPLEAEVFVDGLAEQVVVRGGYTGVGDTVEAEKSVFYRAIEGDMRLFRAENSHLAFENLAFTNGCFATASANGFALHLTKCTTTMRNCAVRENGGSSVQGTYQGTIYLSGGSFTATDCDISDNVFDTNFYSSTARGVGIYATGVSLVTLLNCTVDRNRTHVMYLPNQGLGVYVTGGGLQVSNCTFKGNYGRRAENYAHNDSHGGAIFFSGGATYRLEIADSLFERNWLNDKGAPGGCIYIETSGEASLTRCVFRDNGLRPTDDPMAGTGSTLDRGDVYFKGTAAGKHFGVTNCTFVGTARQDAVKVAAGTADFYRCTFADAAEGYGLRVLGGKATVRDSIIWGNALGGVMLEGAGLAEVTYTDTQDETTGIGNMAEDPLFAEGGWGHLQSEAGYYTAGFTGGVWTVAAATSPMIDKGSAGGDLGLEPQPNKHLPNLGGYAGTEVASMSKLGSAPVVRDDELKVFAYDVSPGEGVGTIRGEVASTGGGANPAVSVVWGPTDGGRSSKDGWAYCTEIGAFAPWELFAAEMTNIAGKAYCRLVVENEKGTAFSDPAIEFASAARPTFAAADVIRVQRTTAYAKTTLSDNGGADTTLSLLVYPSAGTEADAQVLDFNDGFVVEVGREYAVSVAGLAADVEYNFLFKAVNVPGTTTTNVVKTTHTTAARTYYVSTTGAGDKDGASESSAFGSLQDAANAATESGDVIHLAAGEYTVCQTKVPEDLSYVVVSGAKGLTVSGDPAGGTVFTLGVDQKRLLHVTDSTATFNDITFRGGRLNVANSYGHGVYGENSTLVFNRCTFDNNGVTAGTGGDVHRGGGLAANGGSLKLNDCAFTKNVIEYNSSGGQYGGGVWVKNVALEAAGCLFATNYVYVQHFGLLGGAIYADGGSALITNRTFNGNYVTHLRNYGAAAGNGANGGAIYFNAVPSATVVDSTFDGNYANNLHGGVTDYSGGTIFLAGAAGNARIERCKILRGGWWGGSPTEANVKNDTGSMCIAAGTASVVNTLVTGMHSNAFEVAGGTLAITNVTVVGGDREPVLQKGGTLSVVNSIFWDNVSETGVSFDIAGGTTVVSHSDVAGGFEGEGNIDKDPKFSTSKRAPVPYWLRTSSPCANAGDALGWTAEDVDLLGHPRLRGRFVDMGCYECGSSGLLLMLK